MSYCYACDDYCKVEICMGYFNEHAECLTDEVEKLRPQFKQFQKLFFPDQISCPRCRLGRCVNDIKVLKSMAQAIKDNEEKKDDEECMKLLSKISKDYMNIKI